MLDSKILNFHIYRFHLLPLTSNENQIELFDEDRIPIEELKERKNEFFQEILNGLTDSMETTHPIQLYENENDFYIFKIAQRKTTTITQNFKNVVIDNEPFVYIIINNDPEVQKIAISENIDAFSNTDVVKNILLKVFRKVLSRYRLNIAIEALYDSIDFWKYVGEHQDRISYINFQFIKPNLANISKTLPEDFKRFSENVNSHESHISLKAPENGNLENIDQSNENINGLVEYTGEGAGAIKLKVKGIRKQLHTKEMPVILLIDELDIEGAPEQVIKTYKNIVE